MATKNETSFMFTMKLADAQPMYALTVLLSLYHNKHGRYPEYISVCYALRDQLPRTLSGVPIVVGSFPKHVVAALIDEERDIKMLI